MCKTCNCCNTVLFQKCYHFIDLKHLLHGYENYYCFSVFFLCFVTRIWVAMSKHYFLRFCILFRYMKLISQYNQIHFMGASFCVENRMLSSQFQLYPYNISKEQESTLARRLVLQLIFIPIYTTTLSKNLYFLDFVYLSF